MQLGHLGLRVANIERSQRFYVTYIGFDPTTAQRYE
jgi:catechol-2,3-dioxygenase